MGSSMSGGDASTVRRRGRPGHVAADALPVVELDFSGADVQIRNGAQQGGQPRTAQQHAQLTRRPQVPLHHQHHLHLHHHYFHFHHHQQHQQQQQQQQETGARRASAPRQTQHQHQQQQSRTYRMRTNSSEVIKTVAQRNVLPVGLPRRPSVSAIPSQIAYSAPTTATAGGAPNIPTLANYADRATRSASVLTRMSSFGSESDYVCPAAETLKAVQDDHLAASPLSLVELCLRTLCQYTKDWVAADGTPRMNLRALPNEIALQLFEMARKHKLLREDILAAFHRCEIREIKLAQYPGLTDSWLPDVTRLVGLRVLDLSHCTLVTDEGLRSIGALGFGKGSLEVLKLESCVALTDASVAFVVYALARTLRELNLSGCPRLTDATLSRVIMAKELRVLNINRCQLFTPVYLCQLAFLTNLRSLNLGLIPNVDRNVLAAFRPCVQPGAPLLLDAIERCFEATDAGLFPRRPQPTCIDAAFQDEGAFRSMAPFFESDDEDDLSGELAHVGEHGPDIDEEETYSDTSDNDDVSTYAETDFVMDSSDDADHGSDGSGRGSGASAATAGSTLRRVSLDSMLSSPQSGSVRTLSSSPQSLRIDEHDEEAHPAHARDDAMLQDPTVETLTSPLQPQLSQDERRVSEDNSLTSPLPASSAPGDPFLRRVLRPLKKSSSGSSGRRRTSWKPRKPRMGRRTSSLRWNGASGASQGPVSTLAPTAAPEPVSTMTQVTYDLQTIVAQLERVDHCGLYKLEHLDVGYCSVDDLGARHLSCLRNLRALVLAQNPVTAAAAPSLVKLTGLESLDVTQCTALGNGAAQLLSLPRLECLNLEYVPVVRLADEADFARLQELNLSNTSVDDRALAILAKRARELRSLKLEACRVTGSGLAHLAALVRLRELDLSETNLDSESMSHVAALPALVDLNLYQSGVADAGVRIVAQRLYSLERLNIDTGDISDRCLLRLRSLRNLKHLDLFGARVTDRGCCHLMAAGLLHLESLEICGGLITNTGVAHLCSMPAKLKRLNLSQNAEIGDEAVKCLAQAFGMSMRSLSLSGTRITKRSVTLLYSFVFLEELVVRGCKLPSMALSSLRQQLPNLWFVVQ